MGDTETASADLHGGLTGRLLGVFDRGVDDRRKYYEAHPEEAPTAAQIDAIINGCANTNAMIAGGFSLIPGPWGLLALIPEMVMVVQNQVRMIYDIGVASGKGDVLTRELVLSIALSASGTSAMSVLTMKGSTVLVRRTSLRMFQKLVKVFAGKVTQQMVKSAVAKWLPIIGALAIGAWTRYTTLEIGRKAKELLAGSIELEPSVELDDTEATVVDDPQPVSDDMVVAKLLVLDDLMRSDGHAAADELQYISELMARSVITSSGRSVLVRRLEEPFPRGVDLSAFRANRDEAIGLLMDMVAMARRDGEVKDAERAFVLRVGGEIGLSDLQVSAALG